MTTQTDAEPRYGVQIRSATMLETNAQLIRDGLQKPTHASMARVAGFINRAKAWLINLDQVVPDSIYRQHLGRALSLATIDHDQLQVEYIPGKNVVIIDGAFDLEELRKYIMAI